MAIDDEHADEPREFIPAIDANELRGTLPSHTTESVSNTPLEDSGVSDAGLAAEEEAEATRFAEIEQRLRETGPELLTGLLPPDQHERLTELYPEYALGVHQHGSSTVEEATIVLIEEGGIELTVPGDLGNNNVIVDRHSPNYAHDAMVQGYWGLRGGGKYVTAIPIVSTDPQELENPRVTAGELGIDAFPSDFYTDQDELAIDPRYVAGFIDEDGNYHRNEAFLTSDAPNFAGDNAEAAVAETLEPSAETAMECVEAVYEQVSPRLAACLVEPNNVLTLAGARGQTEFFIDNPTATDLADIEAANVILLPRGYV